LAWRGKGEGGWGKRGEEKEVDTREGREANGGMGGVGRWRDLARGAEWGRGEKERGGRGGGGGSR